MADKPKFAPQAWIAANTDRETYRILLTTLGLAYAFPWPTECESGRLRGEAMQTAK